MKEATRRTSLVPLAFPSFVLCLIRVEAEGLLDYQGRAGIISIVRCNLRPVIFRADCVDDFLGKLRISLVAWLRLRLGAGPKKQPKQKVLGRMLTGNQGPRRWDTPNPSPGTGTLCTVPFRKGMARMSHDLGLGCPAIRVRTWGAWKHLSLKKFRLIFLSQ